MAISITSTISSKNSRLIYVIVDREVSVEHFLRSCPLLMRLNPRISGEIRRSSIRNLPLLSTSRFGNIPCLDITLPFMPRCLPKSMTDFRKIIRNTEVPIWKELPKVEIPILPPIKTMEVPLKLTNDEKIKLCRKAFEILENQIQAYTNKQLTIQMIGQLRKEWPFNEDSIWNLSIPQLLLNRIDQLWDRTLSINIADGELNERLNNLRNSILIYKESLKKISNPPRRMDVTDDVRRILERFNSTIF